MKIVYIGSNPADAVTLNLEKEITALQRQAMEASATAVTISYYPGLPFENLPKILHREKPDILHMAVHGEEEHLLLANEAGLPVHVTADMLGKFMSESCPPRLVYLNACKSDVIAKELLAIVPMAIGSDAPITNRAARAAAVSFYERIIDGASVGRAFDVSKMIMKGSANNQAAIILHRRPEIDPFNEFPHPIPRILAEFEKINAKPTADGDYSIRFGLVGCPSDTRQVVFFTEDASFAIDDETYEEDLCDVERSRPVRGVMWSDNYWPIEGDARFYAVGVDGSEKHYSLTTMLSDALETRYRAADTGNVPAHIAEAIADLRRKDGGSL